MLPKVNTQQEKNPPLKSLNTEMSVGLLSNYLTPLSAIKFMETPFGPRLRKLFLKQINPF